MYNTVQIFKMKPPSSKVIFEWRHRLEARG